MRYAIVLILSGFLSTSARAQMVHTQVPLQTFNSGQSRGTSINWQIAGPNWFANFGGGGPLLPPFGGIPSGVSGGFGFGGGDVSGNLGFNFGQSNSQSFSSTTPSLTTMNGVPGSISFGTVRPFVTGFVPVVGDYAAATAPADQAADYGNQLADQQLSSLRQSQATYQNRKLTQYLQRAERAEQEGDIRMARANYRLAVGIAAEPLRSNLQQRMKQLSKQARDASK